MNRDPNALERVETGVGELDEVLGGGLPARSTIVFAGPSGTGKTVLALQTAFHAAAAGKRALYFTTLSEPPAKLLRFMQLYSFFDDSVYGDRVRVSDLGGELMARSVEDGLAELVSRVEAERPDIVIVDSFKAVHDLMDSARGRRAIYELAVTMAGWGATTILVGEYDASDLKSAPEFSIADGILFFRSLIDELTLVRELEVHKLRGSSFATGVHFYDLSARGLSFYPRIRGPDSADEPPDETPRQRLISSHVEGLDELFGGGVPRATSTVIQGATGTGKTVLGMSFIAAGAARGDPGVVLAFEETPNQLRAMSEGLGLRVDELERAGALDIRHTTPVELSPDRFFRDALHWVKARGAQRVLIDSLTTLELGAISRRRFKELIYALIKHLRALGATVMMPKEILETGSVLRPYESGVSFAADNVIHLNRTSAAGRTHARTITILKARGIHHDSRPGELVIGWGGARVIGGGASGESGGAPP